MTSELHRAEGGGLPTAASLPSPLPHAHLSECKLAKIDQSTQTPAIFSTFSAKTCSELVKQMTPEQVDFELQYNREVLGRDIQYRRSAEAKSQALQKLACANIVYDFEQIFYDCTDHHSLITHFSRSINEAQSFISELLSLNRRAPDGSTEEEEFHDTYDSEEDLTAVPKPDISEFELPDPVRFLDLRFDGVKLEDVCNGVNFRKLGARKVAHFGPTPYRYGKTVHSPNSYPANPALDRIIASLSEHLEDFNKSTYSCLITLYEGGGNNLPFHSDNEESIVPGSDIVTVSLGHPRSVVFQNIVGPLSKRHTHPLQHGSVHLMTRDSQEFWEHCIPAAEPSCGPRVSLTFRKLRVVSTSQPIPPIRQPEHTPAPPTYPPDSEDVSSASPTPTPKRLLLLTDSINLGFPTDLVENPDKLMLICVKKVLFELNKLDEYEHEFAYSDYVFISSGINDLSRYLWQERDLFKCIRAKLMRYRLKYPNTTFIFNSLLTTNCGDWLNMEVQKLNHDMFELSLNSKFQQSLLFFDSHHVALTLNRRFNVPIIDDSGNGIHITHRAKREIWGVIRRCVTGLCSDEDVRPVWPVREVFRRFASRVRRAR